MHLLDPFCRLSGRQRWDFALLQLGLAAAALLLAAAPSLAQNAVISHAEQPSRLIRKTTVHLAPAGVRLLAGDIVESGARPVQIEWANGVRLALGPASSVQVNDAGGAPSASLLRGWGKFATAPAGKQLALDAGLLAAVADVEGSGGAQRRQQQQAGQRAAHALAIAPATAAVFLEEQLVRVQHRAPQPHGAVQAHIDLGRVGVEARPPAGVIGRRRQALGQRGQRAAAGELPGLVPPPCRRPPRPVRVACRPASGLRYGRAPVRRR